MSSSFSWPKALMYRPSHDILAHTLHVLPSHRSVRGEGVSVSPSKVGLSLLVPSSWISCCLSQVKEEKGRTQGWRQEQSG